MFKSALDKDQLLTNLIKDSSHLNLNSQFVKNIKVRATLNMCQSFCAAESLRTVSVKKSKKPVISDREALC